MIIDGKKISEEIKTILNAKGLKLAIVQVGPARLASESVAGRDDENSNKFVRQKIKFAEDIGVKTHLYKLPADITTGKLRQKMAEINHIRENNGVILQLPLPSHINTQHVLNGIIPRKDVDVLSSRSFGGKILPPVVGAVKIIFEKYNVDFKNKNIVVVGAGRLVGKPVANWLMNQNASFSVVDKFTEDLASFTKNADIIISGVGKKNLITSDMIKSGAVIIDVGDVAPDAAEKASLFTPAIGGLGPLTVAMVFQNLVELSK